MPNIETGELLCSISGLWHNDSFKMENYNVYFLLKENDITFPVVEFK